MHGLARLSPETKNNNKTTDLDKTNNNFCTNTHLTISIGTKNSHKLNDYQPNNDRQLMLLASI